MQKKILFVLLPVLLLLTLPSIHAHCPLCTAAVGAAAVSAKYYGLDSSIIGLLVGAFGIATGLWVGLALKKEYFRFQLPLIILLSFFLTVIPLMSMDNDTVYLPLLFAGESGSLLNKVYWINKLFFGSIVGGLVTLIAYSMHVFIKKLKGRVLFPFQGVIITITLLSISSLCLYILFGIQNG